MAEKRTGKRGKRRVAPKTVAPDASALPDTAETTAEKLRGRPFKAGDEWNGNAKGRPKGTRHKLAESFIGALAKDFQEHGESAITKVRQDEPAQYLRVVSSLVPKAFDLGDDDEEGSNRIAGVALITRGAIDAIIERGRSDG